MAYDPNDPKDKAILDKAVADALAEQAETHEQEIAGLKANRDRLKKDLDKARKGEGGDNSAEVERLEGELAKAQADLTKANNDLKKANKTVETLTGERDGLNKNLSNLLIDQGLTAALTEAKVDTKFLPAVKAMLSPKVSLNGDGDDRRAVVGDKSLSDFVKEWSQGDEGKAYVSAAGNSGGGAGGSQGGGQGGKTWTRAEYDAADAGSRSAFFAEGGKLTD